MEKCEDILTEITEFCEGCNSSNCCPEEECILYRIEQLVLKQKEE